MNVIAGGIDTTQSQLAHAHAAVRLRTRTSGRCWPAQPELVPQAVDRGAAVRADHAVHRQALHRAASSTAAWCSRPGRSWRSAPSGPTASRPPDEAGQDGAGQDAERFDITVDHADRLLTFGAGPHFCLGSNLARAELEEALAFLAPRMPGLALDGPPALGGVEGIYGVVSLPLRWSAG